MKLWSRPDRIGKNLRAEIGEKGESLMPAKEYVVDIELWHRGTNDLAYASVQEVDDHLQHSADTNPRILDRYVGDGLCLIRVALSGAVLSSLLDLSVVAEAEYPPQPNFDPVAAARLTARDFPATSRPEPTGPRICILDSGVASRHPLLRNNVGHTAAVMSSTTLPEDEHGHGTMVGGLAVFGSVRACYESGTFSSPIILFSARLLDRNNRFDNEKLIVNQIRQAITTFRGEPHNCRVFNLSLGTSAPAFGDGVHRQTVWAESLDILARELKVLLVVSAGNFTEVFTINRADAESVARNYPTYLLEEPARISDPATAAIPITVGALAEHDVPAVRRGSGVGDIVRSIARPDHPAPFTRVGHGLNGAIKPEFVDYGGNAVFRGTGNVRSIGREQGTSVMSFSYQHLQQLFAYDVGTSFAAPLVARNAVLTWNRLRAVLGSEPDPNLVRAVMASAAIVPNEIETIFPDKDDQFRVAGYGRVDVDLALNSSDRRVTLVAQGRLGIDKFAVYSVPIPTNFSSSGGGKLIRVALAFDPPVRRRRVDYLGVQMTFQMIRGRSLDEVINAYRSVDAGEEPDSAIGSPYKIAFEPKESPRNAGYQRKMSTLQLGEFSFLKDVEKYGDTYWLVVRAERKWAPDEVESQDYAVAVVLAAENDQLYNAVSLRLQQRVRVRARR
jgi:subtilisin family serine protease